MIHSFTGTIAALCLPVSNAADGRAVASASSRAPYGTVGFKLSSSDTEQVAQSPVSHTHSGCDQPNAKAARTTKCISGYSVVVCSSKC